LLCEQIITDICVAGRLRRPSLTRKALEMIIDHTWPGNLSELHNVLEHAVTHTNDGLIGPDDLPRLFNAGRTIQPGAIPAGGASIDEITKVSLVAALESCQGNRRRAAQRLQVSLRTIYNMIQRYDLATPRPKGGNRC
jgi:transcriptional regulator of acetoin/glycerol metabolism